MSQFWNFLVFAFWLLLFVQAHSFQNFSVTFCFALIFIFYPEAFPMKVIFFPALPY